VVGLRGDYEPRSDRWLAAAVLWLYWMPFGNRFITIGLRHTLGFYPLRWFGLLLGRLIAEHPHFCVPCEDFNTGNGEWSHLGVWGKCPAWYEWPCGAHK